MFMWDERKDAIRSYNHQDTLAIENEIAKVSNQPPVQPAPLYPTPTTMVISN